MLVLNCFKLRLVSITPISGGVLWYPVYLGYHLVTKQGYATNLFAVAAITYHLSLGVVSIPFRNFMVDIGSGLLIAGKNLDVMLALFSNG